MKLNRKWLLVVALVLSLAMATAGTLAYLTDTDADVNVMTLGNVTIQQNEQERIEIGDASKGLQEFTNNQTMLPAVYELVDANGNKISDPAREVVDVNGYKITYGGGMRTFPNYIDKIVTVTNTGTSDAYVRTLIAVPSASNESDTDNDVSQQWLHFNCVSDTDTTPANGWYYGRSKADGEYPSDYANHYIIKSVEINGAKYDVTVATNVNPVEANVTTGPNLVGLYLDNNVDYKDGKYYAMNSETGAMEVVWDQPELEILVLSQAVQAEGFDDAFAAFVNSFGNVDKAKAQTWFEGLTEADIGTPGDKWPNNNPPAENEFYVKTVQELKDAMLTRGGKISLANDIVVDKDTPLQWGAYMFVANGREVTIDLNGKKIIVEEDAFKRANALFTTANGGTLNIVGEGTVEIKNTKAGIFHAMNKNDQINVYGGTYISNSDNGSDALAIIYTNSGNVDVYGGKFVSPDGVECANAEDAQGNRLSIVFHEGALLKNGIYYAGYDAARIQLEADCELAEVTIDGETWYKVVKK